MIIAIVYKKVKLKLLKRTKCFEKVNKLPLFYPIKRPLHVDSMQNKVCRCVWRILPKSKEKQKQRKNRPYDAVRTVFKTYFVFSVTTLVLTL